VTGPSITPDAAGPGDEPPLVPVSSARTRRVVLWLAVALLVLVAGGVVVLAVSNDDGDGGDPRAAGSPGTDPSTEASAPAGVLPPAGIPSAGVPPGQAGGAPLPAPPDDAFRPVPQLCEEVDFSPVFDILAPAETLSDVEVANATFYQRECTFRLDDAGSSGTFWVTTFVYSSPDEAQGWFDDILAAETRGEPHDELAGDWDANAVVAVSGGQDQADVRFMARDQTLVLNLRAFIVGEAADEAAQQAAVVEVAARVRDGIRA
jgi:hypothetical protein